MRGCVTTTILHILFIKNRRNMRNFTSIAKFAKSVMLAAFVAVGVQVANAQETTTYEPVGANQWWMGETVDDVKGSAYLFNVGAQIFATGNTPSETNIDNADLWTIAEGYTFTNQKTKNVINMYSLISAGVNWYASITDKEKATSFNLEKGTSTIKGTVYCLSKSEGWVSVITRYFTINGNSYSAEKKGVNSDWLFISADQKAAYDEYTTNFNKVKNYLTNEDVLKNEDLVKEINTTLTQTSTRGNNYNTYKANGTNDETNLKTTINDVEKYLEEISTSIKNIESVDGNAEVTAIYDLNGVRKNQLTKGINIVKMANGKVKKVLVK